MQDRTAQVTAEEWVSRKMYSEEFFHACLVDEDTALLVLEAERAGDISLAGANQLWNEIAAGIRFHRLN